MKWISIRERLPEDDKPTVFRVPDTKIGWIYGNLEVLKNPSIIAELEWLDQSPQPSPPEQGKEAIEGQEKETLQTLMSLVRVGYQHAANEIAEYCYNNKVSPQFTDMIIEMLNEDNKKKFVYELFKDELEKENKWAEQADTPVDDCIPNYNSPEYLERIKSLNSAVKREGEEDYNPIGCDHKLPNGFSSFSMETHSSSNYPDNGHDIHTSVCLKCGMIKITGRRGANHFSEEIDIDHPEHVAAIVKNCNYMNETVDGYIPFTQVPATPSKQGRESKIIKHE